MTQRTAELLEAFQALIEAEKRVFTAEILRQSFPFDSGPLDDAETTHAADQLLAEVKVKELMGQPHHRPAPMRVLNPPHPGDFIQTELIGPHGLSVTAAARALRVSRPALSSLLNGRSDLSCEMALRIEKAFGVRMDTLMRMQASYDIAQTRKREREIHVRPFTP
jgi:addiction module HigA family antidote